MISNNLSGQKIIKRNGN